MIKNRICGQKPVIGVIPLWDEEKDSIWMVPGYLDGIRDAGGIPVILPLQSSVRELEQLDTLMDGYLFTGGHDVNPQMYGEAPISACGVCCPERDSLEQTIYGMAKDKDKPILGICRGIQLLNVLAGGTLYQDLPQQFSGSREIEHHMTAPYDRTVHEVEIIDKTPLYALLQQKTLPVNSYHHQGIKCVGKGFEVMAVSEDGLVEGIYAPDKKFVWGVQWHPEFIYQKDDTARKIFRAFVEACVSTSSHLKVVGLHPQQAKGIMYE